nr:hypothetical protein [Tanacetum cinerariifolium]
QNNVDKASESCAQSLEIDNLKHTLSEHLKEKESLEQMVTLLKNDFQKEESRNIDRELALEKQAQQLKPKLYDGSVIQKTDAIVIRDSEETLMLEDESRSKMLQKQKDQMMSEKKVNTKPSSRNSAESNLSTSTIIVEVPKELPKVSMINSSLKKASFDMVVKERTTATTITEGTWGFEHTKACFRDEIIPFVKALKELFYLFDQFLIDELTEVQNVFNQMEQAVEQHCVEKKKFKDKMKDVLKENERLLEQAISTDIVNIVVNANVMYDFGSTMWISLLYRGEYSQWRERFMNYLEEQTNCEVIINSIQNSDHPLPVITQVSLAGTTSNVPPPLKDKSMWTAEEKKNRKIDRDGSSDLEGLTGSGLQSHLGTAAATIGVPVEFRRISLTWFRSYASRSQTGAPQSRQSMDCHKFDSWKNLTSHLPRACLMLALAGFPSTLKKVESCPSEIILNDLLALDSIVRFDFE